MTDVRIDEASVGDAAAIWDVISTAFAARPHLDPSTTALSETAETVEAALRAHGGLWCQIDGIPAGALLFAAAASDRALALRRVCVLPCFQSRGVASALVGMAEEVAAARGFDELALQVRSELPEAVTFWTRRGYVETARHGQRLTLDKALPVEVGAATAEETRALGRQLAGLTRAGDVLILTGELGAGKTTLTQGIALGLQVRGAATSPTFVIARVHPSLTAGPALLHVDAYRLGDSLELDELDLDASLDESVTVIEWGEGIAESLSQDRLVVELIRSRGTETAPGSVEADARTIKITPVGGRWIGAGLRSAICLGVRASGMGHAAAP
ncbi:MAG: tRNA (adenosine(37)-N6)-threonylcarbamoyltransferase complex ATPase subunit type 1 TsaE [Nocardioidaceae bacterium]